MKVVQLPKPDEWGNYYFGGRGKLPAIFPHPESQTWTVLVSSDRGFLCDDQGKRIH